MTDITLDLDNIDTAPAAQPAAATRNTATEKQIAFINRLKAQKDLTAAAHTAEGGALNGEAALDALRDLWRNGLATKAAASKVIDMLLTLPDAGRDGEVHMDYAPGCPNDPARSLEGMHRTGDGTIYKVQVAVHGSGRLYAKRLVMLDSGYRGGDDLDIAPRFGFEYAPGAMARLSEDTRMTLEQAKEFGYTYGTCCMCGRTLTDERSIAAGIGPVCAGKGTW